MVITYFGKQFFRINHGDLTVALNPVGKTRFGSDVVLVSARTPDYNQVELASFGDKKPFVISGPGDYEVASIPVSGFLTEVDLNKKKIINTVYSLVIDEIKICFLGSAQELPNNIREAIEETDIVFVSVGDDPQKAYKLAVSLDPKIIIPMEFDPSGKEIKTFLKEGSAKVEPVEKLTLKRKDLQDKESEIIILKAS